jgi:hypothetical protein
LYFSIEIDLSYILCRSGGGDKAEDLMKLEMKLQQEKEAKEMHLSKNWQISFDAKCLI